MKKIIIKALKVFCISLCITLCGFSQHLRQYTKAVVNGREEWTLRKQFLSKFDEDGLQLHKILPQNIFNPLLQQKINQPTSFLDKRWVLQQPYPTDTHLLATEADGDFIISSGLGIVYPTGYSELIISTDKGETWKIRRFGLDSIITTIDKNEGITWLGGGETTANSGFILKSTDLGKSWVQILSADSFGVTYFNFFDVNNGVALSSISMPDSTQLKIFRTSDGGDSWTKTTNKYKGRTQGFRGLHFINSDEGWICTEDYYPSDSVRIMKTMDGGLSWNVQWIDTITDLGFIEFYNSQIGWAIGQNYDGTYRKLISYSTTDSGNTWQEQILIEGDQYGHFRYDMFIQDSVNGWLAVSERNVLTIYKSNDGFITIDSLSTLYNISLLFGEIEFISETEGWLTSNLGMIYYTSNGGVSWVPKYKSATTANLNCLDFINDNVGWAAGSDDFNNEIVVIKSSNGGVDWEVVYSDSNADFIDMDFISEQKGFIISDNSPHCSINKTVDGGINWIPTEFVYTEINSIVFTDMNNGWAVGGNVSGLFVVHTTNSGDSWIQQDSINLLANRLTKVDFADNNFGLAVGEDGVIIKTTNGGNTWETSWGNLDPDLFWSNYDLTGVYFAEPLTCWITGYRSISGGYKTLVAHTIDGGTNWDTLTFFSDYSRSGDIFFINGTDGYSVSNNNDYRTTDGGFTWTSIDYPSNINKMFFLNEKLGWAVGDYGRIFNYYDQSVGIEDQEELRFPNTYSLFQNFPNPFNPSTTIRYSIPHSSIVIIKIYDVLGNEIETLISEEKPVGTYEISWYTENLSSGIYFYRLQAGEFIETKKMILIK